MEQEQNPEPVNASGSQVVDAGETGAQMENRLAAEAQAGAATETPSEVPDDGAEDPEAIAAARAAADDSENAPAE